MAGATLTVRRASELVALPAKLVTTTAVLTAGYLLWTFQRIYLGPLNEKYKGFSDLSFREAFTLVPLGIIVLILGVYPHAILGLLNTSLVHLNQVVLSTSGAAVAMVR